MQHVTYFSLQKADGFSVEKGETKISEDGSSSKKIGCNYTPERETAPKNLASVFTIRPSVYPPSAKKHMCVWVWTYLSNLYMNLY